MPVFYARLSDPDHTPRIAGVGATSLGCINVTIIGDLYSGGERLGAMGYNASVLNIGTASYRTLGGPCYARQAVFIPSAIGCDPPTADLKAPDGTVVDKFPFLLPLVAIRIGLLVLLGLESPEPRFRERFSFYLRSFLSAIGRRQVLAIFFLQAA